MSMTPKQKEAQEKARIKTPEFRVSYPHVFKPNSIQGSKPKYSVTMLFSKDTDLSPMKEAMKQAKIAKFGSKENWPRDLGMPYEDGDLPKFADKEGYKGHWVFKASTNEDQRPHVVDEKAHPITDPSKFYPGCYAFAAVYAYVWTFANKQGIGFILDGVQKSRDGESFGGRKPADQVFQPLTTDVDSDMDDDSDADDDDLSSARF